MIYFITFVSGERGIVGRMNNIYIYIALHLRYSYTFEKRWSRVVMILRHSNESVYMLSHTGSMGLSNGAELWGLGV